MYHVYIILTSQVYWCYRWCYTMQSCGRRFFKALTCINLVPLIKHVQCQTSKKCGFCLNSLSLFHCDGSFTHKKDWDIRLPFMYPWCQGLYLHASEYPCEFDTPCVDACLLKGWKSFSLVIFHEMGVSWDGGFMKQCRIVFPKVFATTCHWFPILGMDIHFVVQSNYFYIYVVVAFVVTFLLKVQDRKTTSI